MVFGVFLILEDVFMLVIDLRRTNTYLGCIGVQVIANVCFTGLLTVHLVLWEEWGLFSEIIPDELKEHPQLAVLVVSVLLAGVCSLCLIALNLWAIYKLKPAVPMRKAWRINTKDGLEGSGVTFGKPSALGILGCPRDAPIKTGVNPKRMVANFFFRRVRPAEKRIYAFIRNGFAAAAIGLLIFRAITALIQAQNKIATYAKSADCSLASESHNISVLIGLSPGGETALKVGVSASWRSRDVGYSNISSSSTCGGPMQVGNTYGATYMLHLYICGGVDDGRRPSDTWPWWQKVYHIDVRPELNGEVLDDEMPVVWLLNQNELPLNYDLEDVRRVPFYQPYLSLQRGMHIGAEAKLLTRRFIRSSIMKETAFNSEPEYQILSLYPINEPLAFSLNSSDSRIAAATIRTTLSPGLMSFRGRLDMKELYYDYCDFLDDYRTGTILDVIGSVGGLFALLQSVHIFLFGRPLFWGLNGAKLISPFGLLGVCSSKEFKRRLRNEYHTTSAEDPVGTIRIEKFLQDFVIDFGPAGIDPVPEPRSQQPRVGSDPELGDAKDGAADSNEDRVASLPQIRVDDGPAGGGATNSAVGGNAERNQ